MIKLSIVNQSTAFPDAQLPVLANALQIQVTRDFFPEWGVQAQLYWTPSGSHPTADHWVIALLDNADVSGALGYHDITPAGMPLGKVFVKTTVSDGGLVSVTTSHELLEMLADPDINLTAELDNASGSPSKFYAYEVADAVESDADGYDISVPSNFTGGPATVHVSDFVLPSWFEGFRTTGPFDFMGHLSQPFTLDPGGYIGFLDLANLGAGWQQQTAKTGMSAQARAAARPRPGSRRERRALRRAEWMRSTYTPGDTANPAGLP